MQDHRKHGLEPARPAEHEPSEREIDEAIRESFPASDPPAFSTPHLPEPEPGEGPGPNAEPVPKERTDSAP